jgi:hypothetical protein
MIAVLSGWVIALAADPSAGAAPQRMYRSATLAS